MEAEIIEDVNVAELTPKQWQTISDTAKWLMTFNMSAYEYTMLKRISEIKNESDYLNATDEFDDNEDCVNTDRKMFYDTIDDVIDCALFDKAYALPYMG